MFKFEPPPLDWMSENQSLLDQAMEIVHWGHLNLPEVRKVNSACFHREIYSKDELYVLAAVLIRSNADLMNRLLESEMNKKVVIQMLTPMAEKSDMNEILNKF